MMNPGFMSDPAGALSLEPPPPPISLPNDCLANMGQLSESHNAMNTVSDAVDSGLSMPPLTPPASNSPQPVPSTNPTEQITSFFGIGTNPPSTSLVRTGSSDSAVPSPANSAPETSASVSQADRPSSTPALGQAKPSVDSKDNIARARKLGAYSPTRFKPPPSVPSSTTTSVTTTVTTAPAPRPSPAVVRSTAASTGTATTSTATTATTASTPTPPSENEEDIEDLASARGIFGWETIDQKNVPTIFRHKVAHVSVRMVEEKMLKAFPNSYTDKLKNAPPLHSYYITDAERKLLNEINVEHCNFEFGRAPFTSTDVIVKLSDFVKFYEKLKENCLGKTTAPPAPVGSTSSPRSPAAGWLQINNTVTPCVARGNGGRMLPLNIIRISAGLNVDPTLAGDDAGDNELEALNKLCKSSSVNFEFKKPTKMISLEAVKTFCWPKIRELPLYGPFSYAKYIPPAGLRPSAPSVAPPRPPAPSGYRPQNAARPADVGQQRMARPQVPYTARMQRPAPPTRVSTAGTVRPPSLSSRQPRPANPPPAMARQPQPAARMRMPTQQLARQSAPMHPRPAVQPMAQQQQRLQQQNMQRQRAPTPTNNMQHRVPPMNSLQQQHQQQQVRQQQQQQQQQVRQQQQQQVRQQQQQVRQQQQQQQQLIRQQQQQQRQQQQQQQQLIPPSQQKLLQQLNQRLPQLQTQMTVQQQQQTQSRQSNMQQQQQQKQQHQQQRQQMSMNNGQQQQQGPNMQQQGGMSQLAQSQITYDGIMRMQMMQQQQRFAGARKSPQARPPAPIQPRIGQPPIRYQSQTTEPSLAANQAPVMHPRPVVSDASRRPDTNQPPARAPGPGGDLVDLTSSERGSSQIKQLPDNVKYSLKFMPCHGEVVLTLEIEGFGEYCNIDEIAKKYFVSLECDILMNALKNVLRVPLLQCSEQLKYDLLHDFDMNVTPYLLALSTLRTILPQLNTMFQCSPKVHAALTSLQVSRPNQMPPRPPQMAQKRPMPPTSMDDPSKRARTEPMSNGSADIIYLE